MGATFEEIAFSGPLILAVLTAALAGLVSFLSPCILPLVPGYLSYVTGLAGADLDEVLGTAEEQRAGEAGGVATKTATVTLAAGRRRMLAGTLLFVAGFTVVMTILSTVAYHVSSMLMGYRETVNVVAGALIIVFGLAFLGVIPGLQREVRLHKLPKAGLLGAPVFGAVFAFSWMPCVGPTWGAVLTMAGTSGTVGRAVVLSIAYCLGLGLPFVIFGLAFRQLIGVFRAVRRNSRWVTRIGGALLIVVGLALITGSWEDFLTWLKHTFDVGGTYL